MQQAIQKTYAETRKVLNDIYKKRKRTLFFQKIMWGINGLYFVLMLMVMALTYFPNTEIPFFAFFKPFQAGQNNPYAAIYPIVGLFILLYPTTLFFTKAFQKFKNSEAKAIAKMVKSLFPKIEFTQGATAPIDQVNRSKLFAWMKQDSPIYSYGQIRSKTNNTIVNIVDIGIIEENVSNTFTGMLMRIPILNMVVVLYQFVLKNIVSNTSADTVYNTYRGMFSWLSFKKKLNGHTVVLPNTQSTKLDRLASFNFKEEQKIHLEDPRFTNLFTVYSTDQIEARYVLSTALMERIVALKEKFNQTILMSFQNREMFLAVKNDNGLFSFPSGKLDSIKIIEELANDIETALQVASQLKLK